MYVEEIKIKRKEKTYCTYLVRESFREGTKVHHRTIANISNLPQGCIEEIRQYLQGKSNGIDVSKIQLLESKEYGASQALLSLARLLKLGSVINPRRVQWREYVLGLIVGSLIYTNNLNALGSLTSDTMLWELCGCPEATKASVFFYPALAELLARQPLIQKKLAKKHVKASEVVLCYLTNTDILIEPNGCDDLEWDFHQRHRPPTVLAGLWTNFEGCPWGVDIIPGDPSEDLSFPASTKKTLKSLPPHSVVLIGDGHTFTKRLLGEAEKQGFAALTSLTHTQKRGWINKNPFFLTLLAEDGPREVLDREDPSLRYILGFSTQHKQKAAGPSGELSGSFKEGAATTQRPLEERLNDFYILQTNVSEKIMSALAIVDAYQRLYPIKRSFWSIEMSSVEAASLSESLSSHMLLRMLSHHLQWHINQRLQSLTHATEEGKQAAGTWSEALEKLKAIRCQTIQIKNFHFKQVKSVLNADQEKILSRLGISV